MIHRGLREAYRKMARSGDFNILKDMPKGYKNMTWGQKLEIGAIGATGIMSYSQARNEGESVPGAVAQATADAFLINLIGWKKYLAGGAAMMATKGAAVGITHANIKAREMERAGSAAPFAGNTFVDTEQTYTMRQAGMNMIQNSIHNTKAALLGNEAQLFHR